MTYRKNRRSRRGVALLLALSVTVLCAACGGAAEAPPPPAEEPPQQEAPALPSPQPETAPLPQQTPAEKPSPQPEEAGFTFRDVTGLEFYFSSGAGAWRTVLYIHEDGTFDGIYSDSDMGDTGEGYPNGTLYYCEFSGRFESPVNVDEHTWMLEVAELTYARPFGEEELKKGIRYVYSKAFGIAGAEGLFLFAPGTPLAELPEAYLSWVGYYDLPQTEDAVLPFWGLYDSVGETGFSSYGMPSPAELFRAELAWTEASVAETEARLQNAATQTEMNLAAAELYALWDDLLNTEWGYLQQALDEETMAHLTAQQLDWINEKEAAAEAAGAAYAGGSMESMAYGLEAAELTRQRVYVLAEYLD